ncbi:copia protein [Tanacetum coccineum]
MKIKETLNVTFNETPPPSKTSPLVDDDLDEIEAIKVTKKKNLENDIEDETLEIDEIVNIEESRNHPLENVIGNLNQRTLRLVAQGYNQQEGMDYDETYAPVARLESIRILLAYACALDFKLFQIDVKSAFLNSFINEEVTKLTKDEECEPVDSTKYRGMIGSLLYLTESRLDIMFNVCLCARFQEVPKTSHLEAVKRIFRYIKGTTHLGLWYPNGTGIETVVYADSDHTGDYVDRKSTSGHCSYSDNWSLDYLEISSPTKGHYQTTPPSPSVIKTLIQTPRQGLVTRVHNKKTINVDDNEILNREIQHHMSSWVEIIHENVFCLRGPHDHVSACLCHMLYCIETSIKYNLAIFILKRMESIRNTPKEILPYGMLLTRLFTHIVSNLPESSNDRYILFDRVTHPLGPHYEQKTRSDHGTKRCRSSNPRSSSNVLDHPSSHHIDENNDGNN